MAKITEDMIINSYLQAKKVYNGSPLSDAVDILYYRHDMNRSLSRDYINTFKHMIKGELYQRTMNENATNYFLENILSDFGMKKFKLALKAVDKHIDNNSNPLHNVQKLITDLKFKYRTLLDKA